MEIYDEEKSGPRLVKCAAIKMFKMLFIVLYKNARESCAKLNIRFFLLIFSLILRSLLHLN